MLTLASMYTQCDTSGGQVDMFSFSLAENTTTYPATFFISLSFKIASLLCASVSDPDTWFDYKSSTADIVT